MSAGRKATMDDQQLGSRVLFEPDGLGSLRDIYVRDADLRDWQKVLDFLRNARFPLDFRIDGVPTDLPLAADDVLALWERAAPALFIDLEGVRMASYFFAPDEIEFDLDPRDVVRPDQADRVLGFVQDLADLLGKPVLLTPENDPEHPLVRKEPVAPAVR
jgi:hypothetical protein